MVFMMFSIHNETFTAMRKGFSWRDMKVMIGYIEGLALDF